MGRWVVDEAKTELIRIRGIEKTKELSKNWKVEHAKREARQAEAAAAVQLEFERARNPRAKKEPKPSVAGSDVVLASNPNAARYALQQRQRKHQVVYGDGKAYVFHSQGLYCLNLDDGTYTKIGSSSWEFAQTGVYMGNQTALIFHSNAIYSVNLADGSSKQVGSDSGWNGARAAFKLDDGKVLVLHRDDCYLFNPEDGSYTKPQGIGWGWDQVRTFAPLGPGDQAMCSHKSPKPSSG